MFLDRPDFETDNEYQAYLLTCLSCNLMPGLVAETTYEIILALFEEYGGLNAALSADLGSTLRAVGMSGSSNEERH